MKAWQVVRINELAADNHESDRVAGRTLVYSYFRTIEDAQAFYDAVRSLEWFAGSVCKIAAPISISNQPEKGSYSSSLELTNAPQCSKIHCSDTKRRVHDANCIRPDAGSL